MSRTIERLKAIRSGDALAWEQMILEFQGRLMAFAESRLNDRGAAEDVVQETFLGFLTSLPNYDEQTPLDAFLFSIAAHKLTDALRRLGRRPNLFHHGTGCFGESSADEDSRLVSHEHRASTIARNAERKVIEEKVLGDCMRSLVQSWLSRGDFERLKCVELLFVVGLSNKEAAETLGISEQAVANHKSFVVGKLKESAVAAHLRDVPWEGLIRRDF